MVRQAGLAVTHGFLAADGGLIEPLQAVLAAATAQGLADPAGTWAAVNGPLDQLPRCVRPRSHIPYCDPTATPVSQARPAVEANLGLMPEANFAIIGGGLRNEGSTHCDGPNRPFAPKARAKAPLALPKWPVLTNRRSGWGGFSRRAGRGSGRSYPGRALAGRARG